MGSNSLDYINWEIVGRRLIWPTCHRASECFEGAEITRICLERVTGPGTARQIGLGWRGVWARDNYWIHVGAATPKHRSSPPEVFRWLEHHKFEFELFQTVGVHENFEVKQLLAWLQLVKNIGD